MAIIPVGQKFHTLSSTVNTVDHGSAEFQSQRAIYTMQDVIDTISYSGGAIDGSGAQYALPVFTDTNTITNLALGNAGELLTSGGAGADPTWTVATSVYPQTSSTIDYQKGNPATVGKRYWLTFYLENTTVGSPDFGVTTTGPQDMYFNRQPQNNDTDLPFNLFYKQYTPALDPGYDAALGITGNMGLRILMEESVADVNLANGGATYLTTGLTIFTTDMAALSSYRCPLRLRVDNGGASPGNGTMKLRLIYGDNSSPSADDNTALPSTVSVYFRDTTLTTSSMGRPPFNLVWAGADTRWAQLHNGGAAYTAGVDYTFTGNGAGDIDRKYEMFFQDEINAYNRCSYLKVTDGRVVFEDLPTADPVSKGVLWNDAGDLKISLG